MPVPHKGLPPTGPNGPYNDMSGAPVASGSAVQDAGDPYARSYVSPYALYPSWAQEETPTQGSSWRKSSPAYATDGAEEGLTKQGTAWYGRDASMHSDTRPNHLVRINDRVEVISWADEGPLAVNPTPHSDGTQPTEPNNDSGKWPIPRILRAGVGYTFFRNWTDPERNREGFNGSHISLSDNAVVLPVGGMAPQYRKNMRNTYRIEPEPWDLNYVDQQTDPTLNATAPAGPAVPPNVGYGNSYRLG